MRFRLRDGLGYSTVLQIGQWLRAHGTGRHWIEKYRGETFVVVSDRGDAIILRDHFADFVDEADSGDLPRSGSSDRRRLAEPSSEPRR